MAWESAPVHSLEHCAEFSKGEVRKAVHGDMEGGCVVCGGLGVVYTAL